MRIRNRRARGARGTNRGRGLASHCSNCGTAGPDPCSDDCQTDLDAMTDDTHTDDLTYEGWE